MALARSESGVGTMGPMEGAVLQALKELGQAREHGAGGRALPEDGTLILACA